MMKGILVNAPILPYFFRPNDLMPPEQIDLLLFLLNFQRYFLCKITNWWSFQRRVAGALSQSIALLKG